MISISSTRGFAILYNAQTQQFILQDEEGIEIASGATQAEVEAKAEKLSKQAFRSPIPALKVRGLSIFTGRVTSLNVDDKSAYFSYDDKTYQSHLKLRLKWDHAFEITEANASICLQVEECQNQIAEREEKIKSLIDQLEKRIDLAYFGIKGAW